ncbi:PfkB family carbohydrate kinase, partial [Klebsiella pneumoniae]|uniref:PfkB family carbohydrate kinase n=1 Tax=Klebsiella pneumoniae TaxID=573 RepID=UPI001E35DC87
PARELPDELLALVDIITPNETEAEKLTGIRVESDEDAAKAAKLKITGHHVSFGNRQAAARHRGMIAFKTQARRGFIQRAGN